MNMNQLETLITISKTMSFRKAGELLNLTQPAVSAQVKSLEELKQKLADLNQTPQGHIHLGTTTSIAMQILPRVLSYFQNQFPLIKTTIHSMTSSQIMSSVENGSIDIGITYLFEKSTALESSVLYYDTFELVVSPEHPLSVYPHLPIQKLNDVPLIMLSPETAGRRFVDQIFHKLGLVPQMVMELSSSEDGRA
jgi:DNA-binding transcriptional LysR family regulator